jgi:hypothetical protein
MVAMPEPRTAIGTFAERVSSNGCMDHVARKPAFVREIAPGRRAEMEFGPTRPFYLEGGGGPLASRTEVFGKAVTRAGKRLKNLADLTEIQAGLQFENVAAALLEAFPRALALVQSPGKALKLKQARNSRFLSAGRRRPSSPAAGAATRRTPTLMLPVSSTRDVLWDWARSGTPRVQIRAVLVSQHIKRWPLIRSNGPQGATHDPRLSNPYFKGWADLARNAGNTRGRGLCGKAANP